MKITIEVPQIEAEDIEIVLPSEDGWKPGRVTVSSTDETLIRIWEGAVPKLHLVIEVPKALGSWPLIEDTNELSER